ncbi:hypothetical protein NP233_g3094 [Leucocoprinus birnbaumii]|uniref:Nicotinamide-nucleotide adenylyltransferase n=1 Tax=Leucocoprinus birnbaumii TaxID=56174 RepID=A0AAD5VXS3_9AGAR|nr:hypothetical protein NP233_g3094 [Leucocoprinus birnbaumii]
MPTKKLQSTDATYIQRLEMMRSLSHHIGSSDAETNVAIGITNEPTFVGKSTSLLSFLRSRTEDSSFELSFIVGTDTLERLVAPRYYVSEESMISSLTRFLSPEGDNSVVVCARRELKKPSSVQDESEDALKSARDFIDAGRVKLMDIGEDESTFSSTNVRKLVKELGVDDEGRKVWGRFVVPSVADYISNEKLYVG